MPFYDYRCEACGFELEAMQKISEPALVDCPVCHEPTLKKQLSAPQFRLKGGGWYETDFKSGNKKNLHDGGKEEKPKPSTTKSEGKAETKPAKKTADVKAAKS